MYLKKIIPIVLVVSTVSFFFTANAQDEKSSSSAAYFYFINGYAAAYKFQADTSNQYRLHFDLSTYYSDGSIDYKSKRYSSYDTSSTNGTYNDKNTNYAVTISPQYLLTVYKSELACLYLGGGPSFGYRYEKIEWEDDYNSYYTAYLSENNIKNTSRTNTYSLGLTGFIGIEGRIAKSVSVFAETQLSGGRYWKDGEIERNNYSVTSSSKYSSKEMIETNESKWYYSLTGIRVGIGFYF